MFNVKEQIDFKEFDQCVVDKYDNLLFKFKRNLFDKHGKLLVKGICSLSVYGEDIYYQVEEPESSFRFDTVNGAEKSEYFGYYGYNTSSFLSASHITRDGLHFVQKGDVRWINPFFPGVGWYCVCDDYCVFPERENRNKFHRLEMSDGKATFLFEDKGDIGRHWNSFDKKWVQGSVNNIAGVFNNILWVDYDLNSIIGYDIFTGKKVHEFQGKRI